MKKILILCLISTFTLWGCGKVKTAANDKTRGLKLKEKTFCSDVCPENTRKFQVYENIKTPKDCQAVGGQTIRDAAWGGFIGCGPKKAGEAAEVEG
ncbi:MAG: hypothetical protein WC768_04095 [Patescibacteria group bacterium]|jgi:hypothetical protein